MAYTTKDVVQMLDDGSSYIDSSHDDLFMYGHRGVRESLLPAEPTHPLGKL